MTKQDNPPANCSSFWALTRSQISLFWYSLLAYAFLKYFFIVFPQNLNIPRVKDTAFWTINRVIDSICRFPQCHYLRKTLLIIVRKSKDFCLLLKQLHGFKYKNVRFGIKSKCMEDTKYVVRYWGWMNHYIYLSSLIIHSILQSRLFSLINLRPLEILLCNVFSFRYIL